MRPADLRFSQDPPIISLRPEVTGNRAKRGRHLPLFDISRQWFSKSMDESRWMKEAALEAGINPDRAHRPHALRHTYGRNAVLSGVPTPVLQPRLGQAAVSQTGRYVELAGATTPG